MALIKCSECGREVSDKVPACPGCGNPINGQVQIQNNQNPVVIEQTSKTWKALQLLAAVIIILGLFIAFSNAGSKVQTDINTNQLGTFWLGLGVILLIIGKIGAWWNHR